MKKRSHSGRVAAGIALIVLVVSLVGAGEALAQQSACERCHTDETLLKSLFKPVKAAPAESGEG